MAEADEILAQQRRAFVGDRLQLRHGQAPVRRAEPHVDPPGVRTIRHAQRLARAVENGLQLGLERGFAHARRPQLDIRLAFAHQPEPRQPGQDLFSE